MKVTETDAYYAILTVGQIEGYHGDNINKTKFHRTIREYQETLSDDMNCTVKTVVSKVQFKDYYEFCWDVSVIQYPRFPKPVHVIEEFMLGLAQHLMKELNQNRITVCFPDRHVMLEKDEAEDTHK